LGEGVGEECFRELDFDLQEVSIGKADRNQKKGKKEASGGRQAMGDERTRRNGGGKNMTNQKK